jgi:hypothetical protein
LSLLPERSISYSIKTTTLIELRNITFNKTAHNFFKKLGADKKKEYQFRKKKFYMEFRKNIFLSKAHL